MLKRILFSAVLMSVTLSSANAAFIQFFGQGGNVAAGSAADARADFLAGLSALVGTETFESLSVGATNPVLSFPGSSGSITATLTGAGSVNTSNAQRYNTSAGGSKYFDTGAGGDFNIVFSSGIAAFGFFGTDIGDVSGDLALGLTGDVAQNIVLDTSGSANANLLFWGFIDTVNTYSAISFTNTASGDFFGYDDMTIGDLKQVTINQVPAPATFALFVLGVLATGAMSRKKKA